MPVSVTNFCYMFNLMFLRASLNIKVIWEINISEQFERLNNLKILDTLILQKMGLNENLIKKEFRT